MSNLNVYIAEGEHKTQEFKESYSKTMLKTVAAFANYHDGRIIIGVTDEGKVVGVSDLEALRLRIEGAINDAIRPRPFFEVDIYHVGHKDILVYKVYKGDHTPYTYNHKAFERNDTATIEVNRERYDELVLHGKNLNFEDLVYEGKATFKLLSDLLSEALDIPTTDMNVLKSLGLYKNNAWNNAAALLADSSEYDSIGFNLIHYSDQSMTMIEDRVSLNGISILKHFKECMNFYSKYIRQKDIIKGERRQTYGEIPLIAYREAVINAIVHRDYSKRASNRVEFFPDRVEILSVGALPIGTTEEEYINGSYSNLRNPILADVFFRLGYVEKMGTGIRRIKQSYAEYSVKPKLKVMKNSILIILPLITEITANGVKEKNITVDLTVEEEKLYAFFDTEGSLTRSEVEQYMAVKKTKAVKLLNSLSEKNLIVKTGSGRSVIYDRAN